MRAEKWRFRSFRVMMGLLTLLSLLPIQGQTIQTEMWFDDGADSLTLNNGLSGRTHCYLRDNPKTGDGATIGPVWSDSVRFPYEGNHSLRFNGGKQFVDLGSGRELESFTIEAWFRVLDSTRTYIYLVQGCDEEYGITFHFRLMNTTEGLHKIDVWIMDMSNGGWMKMQTDDVVKMDQWMHAAVVYDVATGGRLFLDGEEVSSIPAVVEPPALDGIFRVGHPFGSSMVGWIDEVRISDFPRIPGDGSGTGFSLAWDASIRDLAPPAPVLVSPEDGFAFVDTLQTFSWENVSEADAYRLLISPRFDFLSTVVDTFGLYENTFTAVVHDSSSYYWRVGAANEFGVTNWSEKWYLSPQVTEVVPEGAVVSSDYQLSQNFPNPFNPTTTIHYHLATDSDVKIAVYDILGNQLQVLVDGFTQRGYHQIDFDGSQIPSGVYLYRMEIADFQQTRKMIIMK